MNLFHSVFLHPRLKPCFSCLEWFYCSKPLIRIPLPKNQTSIYFQEQNEEVEVV